MTRENTEETEVTPAEVIELCKSNDIDDLIKTWLEYMANDVDDLRLMPHPIEFFKHFDA